MARSRNIKPSFFSNDELAELDPLARLFFIGLWTVSDFKGDLEFREKRLKAQLLPYDNCDISEIVINLDKSRFITIYNVKEITYIHINNFTKHQNPHPNEKKKGSEVPEFKPEYAQLIENKEVAINNDKSRSVSEDSITDRAVSCFLIPDPPNPDSFIPDPGNLISSKTIVEQKPDYPLEIFQFWQSTFNHPKAAFDDKRKSLIKKQLKNYSAEDIKTAITGCSRTPWNIGDNPDGRVYDSIELILRDSKHIDDYMRNANNPPLKGKTIQQSSDEYKTRAARIAKGL